MAKKIDLEALRQQINELQIDKDLKHDLLAAINDKQRYGLLPSQRLIASHPQQDDCKSTKKNWDLQENRKVSCKSQ